MDFEMEEFLNYTDFHDDFDLELLFKEETCDVLTTSEPLSSFEFYGFSSPDESRKDSFNNYIQNQMNNLKILSNCDSPEHDIIDGITFLSFESEKELIEFSKHQQTTNPQSDDGLEILDDGSFSDRSSNHAIIPTKTKDITRIKGWRNKHFAGLNVCDDSRSSIKNDDDGFGDDLEIKSVIYGSSEEMDSVDYSSIVLSKDNQDEPCSTTQDEVSEEFSHSFSNKSSDAPADYVSNAVDYELNEFNCKRNVKTTISNSSSSNNININHLNVAAERHYEAPLITNFNVSKGLSQNNAGLLSQAPDPLNSQKSKENYLKEFDGFYKSRVKLLDCLTEKVRLNSLQPFEGINDNASADIPKEKPIRWRLPKEKLLSGNIFDLEVTPIQEELSTNSAKVSSIFSDISKSGICANESRNMGKRNLRMKDVKTDENGAFQSSTLEHFTTNLGALHIDFTIPKLEAIDNVTLKDVEIPEKVVPKSFPSRNVIKPLNVIKAKTVAERKQLLAGLDHTSSRHKTTKKSKQTFIIKKYNDSVQKKVIHNFRKLFNDQGIIVYGREKPLRRVLNKRLLSYLKTKFSNSIQDNTKENSESISMIVNIGFNRPLYKEIADNINNVFNNTSIITEDYARFAVSAMQPSINGPFTVTRFLFPVRDEMLCHIMQSLKLKREQNQKCNTDNYLEKLISSNNAKKIRPDQIEVDSEVEHSVNNIVNYVVKKEIFDEMHYNYDPDVPIVNELANYAIPDCISKPEYNHKKKKTKLQRQIERLGGTFIAVQDNEDEENQPRVFENEHCIKEHCRMGCVCLQQTAKAEHCGKEACMFSCRCSLVSRKEGCEIKSKTWLLPEVLRLKTTSQANLAPIEREYHQTVIMSHDKTITIETQHKKRERKIPSKFKDEILLDYRKYDDYDDNEFGSEYEIEKGRRSTRHTRMEGNCSPKIFALDAYLHKSSNDKPSKYLNNCYVTLENLDLHGSDNSPAKSKSPVPKKKNLNFTADRNRLKSRNVALKRTGFSYSQSVNADDKCSRTRGSSITIVKTNHLSKIHTKNMYLYPATTHKSDLNDLFHSHPEEERIFKEDLQEDMSLGDENEAICFENISHSNESGLAIDFVCSLLPEQFENQGSPECDDVTISENSTTESKVLEREINYENGKESDDSVTVKGKREKIVYAMLPTVDAESKWWVVEIDANKFSHLIYFTDERSLTFNQMCMAIFRAEFSKKVVRISLNKPHFNLKDIFGAYAVPGHKHLIFFGPYNLNESHGIKAVKLSSNGFEFVSFTTKFSESERFKSLGVNMANDHEISSTKSCINAVWWYSRGKVNSSNKVNNERHSIEDGLCGSTNDILYNTTVNQTGNNTICHDTQQPLVPSCNEDNTNTQNMSGFDKHTEKSLSVSNDIESLGNDIINQGSPPSFYESEDLSMSIKANNKKYVINGKRYNKQKSLKEHGTVLAAGTNRFVSKNRCKKINNEKTTRRKITKRLQKGKSRFSNKKKVLNKKRKTTVPKIHNFPSTDYDSSLKHVHRYENPSGSKDETEDLSDFDLWNDDNVEGLFPKNSGDKKIHRVMHPIKNEPLKLRPVSKGKTIPDALFLDKPIKGDVPKSVFMCLTPDVGYIPVLEHSPKTIVIVDPFDENMEHQFAERDQASEWLNKVFKEKFMFMEKFDLEWCLVIGSLVARLPPLNREVFNAGGKNIQISRRGVTFTRSVEKQAMKNDMERARRRQLNNYRDVLIEEVWPDIKIRPATLAALSNAQNMIEAQHLIALELSKEFLIQKRNKTLLLSKLRRLLTSVPESAKKEFFTNLYNARNAAKLRRKDDEEVYVKNMKAQELNLIGKLNKGLIPRPYRPPQTESNADYRDSNSNDQRASARSDTGAQDGKKQRRKARPTEGQLIKQDKVKKLLKRKRLASREVEILNQKPEEVIDLVDSDDDANNTVIEILSDEEEEVMIIQDTAIPDGPLYDKESTPPPPPPIQVSRRKQIFPNENKVRRVNVMPKQQLNEHGVTTLRMNVPEEVVERPSQMESEDVHDPVEFVAVPENCYEVCDRVSEDENPENDAQGQFLPMSVSNRVNIINTSSSSIFPSKSKPVSPSKPPDVPKPTEKKKDLFLTPIGRINPLQIKGKPILISKGKEGFKLAKLPESPFASLLNTARPPTTVSALPPRVVSPARSNTVTLYHPSEELSETRVVQFADLSGVDAQTKDLVTAGPRIRKPKSGSKLRVMLPNRSRI